MRDLQLALRGIRGNPGFAALVIATMALGIGANTTMFSVVRAVFLRPLPFPDQHRLVTLWERDTTRGIAERLVTPANFADWEAKTTATEVMGPLLTWAGPSQQFNVVRDGGVERVEGIYASSGFFRVMNVAPVIGQTLTSDDDRRAGEKHVVIGYRYWQERFNGDPTVIGKTIDVDTFRGGAFQIAGVMPPEFDLPRGAQIWLSLGDSGVGPMPGPDNPNRCCSWYTVLAKLKPGVGIRQAEAELSAVARRVSDRYPSAAPVTGVAVKPLRDALVGRDRSALFALFAAAGCVLLIGCTNVANLLLSRGIARRRELLTRQALGATRWQIARQLLAESLVLSACGAAAGMLLAALAQPLAPRLFKGVLLAEQTRIDWTVLLFLLLLTVASGLMCGLAPLVETRAADWSSRGQTENPFSRRLRNALVIGEMAVAVMLVTGAGLFLRTVAKLSAVDVGFRTDHVLTVTTDLTTGALRQRGNSARFLEELLPRIASLPGVRMASAGTVLPFESGRAAQAITREDRSATAATDSPHVIHSAVTPRYFETIGIRLKAGRSLAETDVRDGKLVAVLNETAARRYWPGEDPIGKRFAIGSRERFGRFREVLPGEIEWREIVGVVSDIRTAGQNAPVEPEVYYCYKQFPVYDPKLVVRTQGDPAMLAGAIRREIQAVNSHALVIRVRTMEQVERAAIAAPRMRAAVAGAFSVVALALGMLGIYGVMSYTVARRTQEIGIRMALGAQAGQVFGMILWRAILLTVAGVVLGLAGSMAVSRWISAYLFGVQSADAVTMAATCVLLALAAVTASYLPARRAARVDPMAALRSE